ncbi:hypothetical protein [Amaricoccus macauensis]|uniref:hypothetical protein n=1 Tax=Amaricoccus macauensis TaxID=57001 RepID=UPI003C798E09
MSAPDTDLEKQKKRHAVPLAGMVAVIAIAILGLVFLISFFTKEPGADEEPAAEVSTLVLPAETIVLPV